MELRILVQADAPALESFLAARRDTSMFLRANARKAGLEYHGEALQSLFAAAFRDGQIVGVVSHSWSGMVLVQAPEALEELVCACVEWSGRKVTGLSGPLDQTHRARSELGLSDAPAAMASDEWLYSLELSELVIPSALGSGRIVCRPPCPEDRDLLCAWRVAYDIEALGAADSEETRQRSASFLDWQIAGGDTWVAVDRDAIVSLSAFNASLPDIVQLGGIYTPPEFRGRGYAKVAVAGSLSAALERGVSRAVLFTKNPSAARCYEALGFRRTGNFGLVLLR